MASTVYLATNRINGKRYVGVTSKKLARRQYEHEWHAFNTKSRKCPKFYAAIRKYGVGAFDWQELRLFETFPEALAAERRYISDLRPEYNLTAGGEGTLEIVRSQETIDRHRASRAGWRPTQEMRRRQSAGLTGHTVSVETRKKLSEAMKRRTLSDAALHNIRTTQSARAGWKHTPETRAKMSATRKGRARPDWVMRKIVATKKMKRSAGQMEMHL